VIMRKRHEPVNPEMMVLARQSRGFSQTELARYLSVSPGWLSKVEAGIKEIPKERLLKIAKILDYPISFFKNTQRIYGPGINGMFHRKRYGVSTKVFDKNQARMEIRRMNLASLLSGIDIGDIEIPSHDLYEFNGSVKDIARAVRAAWQLPGGPIVDVVKVIEEARGIIISMNFENRLIDATSYWPRNMPPLFFVDFNYPTDRIRFSLCHELGHIVLHQDNPNPYMEKQANDFAAEFLMPEADIRPYLVDLSLEKLASLKPYWKVSMAALLHRARDIQIISERQHKTLWIEMGKAGYRIREPIELDIPQEKPKLMEEIIGTYSNEMEYSLSDLAKLFRLHEHEVCKIYFEKSFVNRNNEAEAAIQEVERILKEYRQK
jgi:Zn-dependent peptidase ImmA (M78 family)/transcriptional regulator with XRE-family HTH domain